ncbi:MULTISPECIES: ABC transporter ATP-binding protein [Lacticaseibacillus]|uniref:ABC transporter ATP-binding protein n=3 Tax=Lacticaseibacillus TaxID=2759736 RepID=A0A0R1QSD2_9LACO|nr:MULTISPECIES: ATP-binding cassette domain-containing protein [Lacticaseibacillus]KRL47324.1 ABC transporter ATP-binding protein [Lacticaseibacillus manihotivorans DSM 13343 = JCM 12514]QFQ90572.1 ATP-binding cassette domain-containing protein [Lacticaseibacillus manihotivorans]
MSNPLIELRHVSKQFHHRVVLHDINLTIYAHRIYGFSGPNGSGKTLTFKTILGFAKASSGQVQVNGAIIRKDTLFAPGIGFALSEYNVLPNKNGRENLALLALLAGNDQATSIDELLTLVGLSPTDPRKVKDYSLGMRQRLLVAVALIGDHPIVIFDEPTNALDEDGQQFMITLIKDLQARGKTVLVSSHDAAFLKAVSDEIFYFSDGQIVRTEACHAD